MEIASRNRPIKTLSVNINVSTVLMEQVKTAKDRDINRLESI